MFRKKTPKDYTLSRQEVLPREKIDEISTILECNNLDARNFRNTDHISSKFQSQSFSIRGLDEPQYFKIETDSMKGNREFYSITKVIFVYLGLYPKDNGLISFRLRSDAYRDDVKKTEFESNGGAGTIRGYVTAMNHCIATEDSDTLFTEIKVMKSSIRDAIIGKVYMLWEFEETDMPLLYKDPGVVQFSFKDLDNRANLNKTADTTWKLFQEIARGKRALLSVTSVLNKNYVEMTSPKLMVDLESSKLPKLPSAPVEEEEDLNKSMSSLRNLMLN